MLSICFPEKSKNTPATGSVFAASPPTPRLSTAALPASPDFSSSSPCNTACEQNVGVSSRLQNEVTITRDKTSSKMLGHHYASKFYVVNVLRSMVGLCTLDEELAVTL